MKTLSFEQNKLSSDDFLMTTWEGENESERKKESQIPRLKPWQNKKGQIFVDMLQKW